MRRHALLVLTVGLLLAANPRQDDAAKADLEKLQGNWKMSALTVAGNETPAEKTQSIRLTVKGDKYNVKLADQTITLTFKLDASKPVKEIDLTYDDGPNKGKTNKAIYKVDGDTLTMCRPQEPEQDRPKEFVSKEGSTFILSVWKRDK